MPTPDADRLADLANAASNLAEMSCRLTDHADAAKAHFAAYKASSGSGASRPSFSENHLRRATEHDKVASEPESYAQKNVLARAASKRADKAPGVENFREAAKAHRAASAAWRKENPLKTSRLPGGNGGDPWEVQSHDRQANNYEEQATFLEKKGDDAAGDAARLEKKLAAPSEPEAPAKAAPSKKTDARAFSSASKDGY